MSGRTSRVVSGVSFLLAVLGCGRKTDYLYYSNPDKPVSFEHKVKELNGNADLDILWVIDNMNSFIQGLVASKNLKWKMGLISTSQYEQPYIGFSASDALDYTSVDAVNRFNLAVSRLGAIVFSDLSFAPDPNESVRVTYSVDENN